jgi:hypothetical protein
MRASCSTCSRRTPDGAVNGNRRSRELVLRTAPGALAHELQHLASASRRLYVTAGAAFPRPPG